jgi:hypothetical protein
VKIGYAKLGRSFDLNPEKASVAGGDMDVIRTLKRLSYTWPEHEFILVGRNSGEDPHQIGYPTNVSNPWSDGPLSDLKVGSIEELAGPYLDIMGPTIDDLDAIVVWAGQHGSTNTKGIPPVKGGESTNPQVSALRYSSYILQAINRWRDHSPLGRQEVWLCPDPRNYLKCRDLKWPLEYPVLAQYDKTYNMKHERYGDTMAPGYYWEDEAGAAQDPESPTRWLSKQQYIYSGLELTALPHPSSVPYYGILNQERSIFGLVVNENRANIARARKGELKKWVLSWNESPEIHGIWTKESKAELGIDPKPVPYEQLFPTLGKWVSTFTMPASGSGWATAKPWECFAVGTVCFFHPDYDTQGHIIPRTPTDTNDPEEALLAEFLRVPTPQDLHKRVARLMFDRGLYERIANLQRRRYEHAFERYHGGTRDLQLRLFGASKAVCL